MARIPRIIQKIFARNRLGTTDVGRFGSFAGGSAQYASNAIEAQIGAHWENGWADAVNTNDAPTLEDMNAVHYALSQQIAYMLQRGIPEWSASEEYHQNCFVSSGGSLYRSKTDNNLNNALTNNTHWELFNPSTTASPKTIEGMIATYNGLGSEDTSNIFGGVVENSNPDAYLGRIGFSTDTTLASDDTIDYYILDFGTFSATEVIGSSILKTGNVAYADCGSFTTSLGTGGLPTYIDLPDIDLAIPDLEEYGVMFQVKNAAGTAKEITILPPGQFGGQYLNQEPWYGGETTRILYFNKESAYLKAATVAALTDGSTNLRSGPRVPQMMVGWKIKV